MKLALVSDAWTPQVNGVVRTLQTTVGTLRRRGYEIELITPDTFRTIACPTYPEIRLALGSGREVARRLAGSGADAIHIATEGPLGWAARRWCRRAGMPFSTSFHTRFPDYLAMRTGLSPRWFWPAVRRFHRPARTTMVATQLLADELEANDLPRTHRWSRGVDLAVFSPAAPMLEAMRTLPGPVQLYVGRIAVEKNIAAFLDAPSGGSKVIVGKGPARSELQRRYPDALFLGELHGEALASAYASADVFVFPSRTDTFGLVMIEALACGTPVAAYPVGGALEIVGVNGRGGGHDRIGALDESLGAAIALALTATRADCADAAQKYSWDRCTDQFFAGLVMNTAPRAVAT